MENIEPRAILINTHIGKDCWIGRNSRVCYSKIGDYSYISSHSYVFSTLIGKFTSISWNVSINPAAHDIQRFTQHPILVSKKYRMLPGDKPFYNHYKEVSIGNDVWIGCNCLIGGGVTIGNGAIIGAGSRITKDVEPYTVMIGNNQFLKYRFPKDIIKAMIELNWWDFETDFIKENIDILASNPTIKKIEELKNKYQDYKRLTNSKTT